MVYGQLPALSYNKKGTGRKMACKYLGLKYGIWAQAAPKMSHLQDKNVFP